MTQPSLTHATAGTIELRPINSLVPYARNARTHSRAQIAQVAESIRHFGFVNPIVVDASGTIIAGHGRLMAARQMGLTEVPVLSITHLTDAEVRAYVLADNRLAEKAGWDQDLLAIELQGLIDLDFDVTLTGFALAEIDVILDGASDHNSKGTGRDAVDEVAALPYRAATTRLGDLWHLGPHRLICGDAREAPLLDPLLAGEEIDMIFTDPPYNVAIDGHVSGLGKVRHREFAMASGEMSKVEFTRFLKDAFAPSVPRCRSGAIAFTCIDWRHIRELLEAGDSLYAEMKNLCVWSKTNGGMGTFYRSKHELVFVWKVRPGAHVNSFELGQTGRYRTNVWGYAGVNSFGAARDAELTMHPTVKPVELVGDAIRDCSRRGDLILDMFGGSGTTLIAADQAGRRARLIEYDPRYCDTILLRWERLTGKCATLDATGQTRESVTAARLEAEATA